MSSQRIVQQVRRYYDGKLAEHGPTVRGVDWNSEESQRLRFRDLVRVMDVDPHGSVIDYGCGYGALATYLREHGFAGAYCGFDISAQMIDAARARHVECPDCRFVDDRRHLTAASYAIASGIFNVKQDVPHGEWQGYMLETIADLASLGTRGIAFNALSTYSDPERRRPDLYYADPLVVFDHCKRHISRFVSLLHDSALFEFTVLVRF